MSELSNEGPTREEVAEALYENEFDGVYHVEWPRLISEARDHWLSHADVVISLFAR